MNIGAFLKESRKIAELTQEEMAHLSHISRPTISKLESGDRSLKVDDLLRWLQVIQTQLQTRLPASSSTTAIEAGIAFVNGVDIALLTDMLTKIVGGCITFLGGFL